MIRASLEGASITHNVIVAAREHRLGALRERVCVGGNLTGSGQRPYIRETVHSALNL